MDATTPFVAALEAARRGDAEALEILTERFYPTVQRLVHHRLEQDLRRSRPWLTSRFSTGDVVQDVFIGVLRDLDAFAGDNEGAFVGYLAMVVRNRIIDAVRFHEAECRDGRRLGALDNLVDLAGPTSDPASEAASAEQMERVRLALKGFEPREQLLLRARLENLATFSELADQLGFSTESGARRAFYAAQARLALALKEA
ncbi:MAG TPA: sigma-70 family RNA polymerase sigma factor [Planctomycetota bacterium]|nr:sigma-70 family RNA polymerase sigma factor [Planctomycetota bacterium]